MQIAAAVPTIPWSDLAYSLAPNGRTLDYRVTGRTDDLYPLGMQKQSYVTGLYAAGLAAGYYSPAGAGSRRGPDGLVRHHQRRRALRRRRRGRPCASSRATTRPTTSTRSWPGAAADLQRLHRRPVPGRRGRALGEQGQGQRHPQRQGGPAALRLRPPARAEQGRRHGAPARAHAPVVRPLREGRARARPSSGVEALTQTCPKAAPSGGPYSAPTWDALSPGEVRYRDDATQDRAVDGRQAGRSAGRRPDLRRRRLRSRPGRRRDRHGHLPPAAGHRLRATRCSARPP